MNDKTYVHEVIIGTLILIIISLCFILTTSNETLSLMELTEFLMQLITLVVISLTASFTMKSAKAAKESAASSENNIKLLQLAEKRKIKPQFTISKKELNLRSGLINEKWDERNNELELNVLSKSIATNVTVNIKVMNIHSEFVEELRKSSVNVEQEREGTGLLKGRLYMENELLSSWAVCETSLFEALLTKEVNNGKVFVEIPEAYIYLMNSFFRVTNSRIRLPFLEIKISYSDVEGNEYEEKWGFHFKSKTGSLGSPVCKVLLIPIKY